jgi:hypothetical protein
MLGHSGKEKMRTARLISQTTLCALFLANCATRAAITYAGDLTPQSGTCDPPARAILVTRGRDLQFTPTQGVLILPGQITPSGHIEAALQTQGADRKPYLLKLTATLTGQAISGTYVTPRCRYAVHLTQAP